MATFKRTNAKLFMIIWYFNMFDVFKLFNLNNENYYTYKAEQL